ncbi:unnamed protein product [Rhizophagus irregularis]|nr:unnamed protein product [Rhizophagus irregularis]
MGQIPTRYFASPTNHYSTTWYPKPHRWYSCHTPNGVLELITVGTIRTGRPQGNPGSPYSGTIPPRITNQGPSAVGNRTPYLMPTPSAGNVLVGLEPNRRPNYYKDIAPKTLPSIGPSSPEGPQVV